jgi:hypothetical protein
VRSLQDDFGAGGMPDMGGMGGGGMPGMGAGGPGGASRQFSSSDSISPGLTTRARRHGLC